MFGWPRDERCRTCVMREPISGHAYSSRGHHEAIKRQSRGHQEAIKRPSRGHQEAIKRSSRGHQEVIKRSSRGHQEAIKRPSRGHHEAITRPSRGHQEVIKRSSRGHQEVLHLRLNGRQSLRFEIARPHLLGHDDVVRDRMHEELRTPGGASSQLEDARVTSVPVIGIDRVEERRR
jgi:hypothetical protein